MIFHSFFLKVSIFFIFVPALILARLFSIENIFYIRTKFRSSICKNKCGGYQCTFTTNQVENFDFLISPGVLSPINIKRFGEKI